LFCVFVLFFFIDSFEFREAWELEPCGKIAFERARNFENLQEYEKSVTHYLEAVKLCPCNGKNIKKNLVLFCLFFSPTRRPRHSNSSWSDLSQVGQIGRGKEMMQVCFLWFAEWMQGSEKLLENCCFGSGISVGLEQCWKHLFQHWIL